MEILQFMLSCGRASCFYELIGSISFNTVLNSSPTSADSSSDLEIEIESGSMQQMHKKSSKASTVKVATTDSEKIAKCCRGFRVDMIMTSKLVKIAGCKIVIANVFLALNWLV